MTLDHLARLRTEGSLLIDAVRRVDLDARVPGLDWNARTVAVHTGAVHRWAADIVDRALPTNETGGSIAFWPAAPLADADLPEWLASGLERLIAVLDWAPADLQCFTFIPGVSAREFWQRRQLHETAVHRADLESVCGPVSQLPVDVAQDGLAELVGAFATERRFVTAATGSVVFDATDGAAWRIEFGPDGNRATTGPGETLESADATVRGCSGDLYLWAWNRAAAATVSGDPAAIERWRRVRI